MSVADAIAKKVKIRAAHRGSATKLLNRLKDRLSDEENPVDEFWLKESIQSMRLKIESLKTLDDQIIDLIASGTAEGVEERIEKEIENSDGVRAELNEIVMRMEEMMSSVDMLISMTENWKLALDNGHTIGAVSIDFQRPLTLFLIVFFQKNSMRSAFRAC